MGIFIITFLITACSKNVKRPKATKVIYQETIQENDFQKIVRTCVYKIDSTRYDTIVKHQKSTIEILSGNNYQNVPENAVDLNDIFGKYDPDTDWNFTELDEDEWEYLKKLGVYWDDSEGCYRKKETH